MMKKSDAVRLFGNQSALARAVGLSRSSISQWPPELDQKRADLVRGAALRLGKLIDEKVIQSARRLSDDPEFIDRRASSRDCEIANTG
jgi:transcriptional regulator with XRE-family HTH domain